MPLDKGGPHGRSLLMVVLVAIVLFMLGAPDSVRAAPGDLDPTFGSGGQVITDFGGTNERALALVLQPDGKIVAAGFSGPFGSEDFALARYNRDGSLDPTFGSGGKVTTDFGGNRFNVSFGRPGDLNSVSFCHASAP